MRWARPAIELRLAPPPASWGISIEDALGAARRAARSWDAAGVPSIHVERADTPRFVSEDGESVIVFRSDGWCSQTYPDQCYDPAQVAITHVHSGVSKPSETNAEISETDVEINLRNPYFNHAGRNVVPRLQAALTHELGHVLGLDHNCSATPLSLARDASGAERPACSSREGSVRAAAMYPGLTEPDRQPVLLATAEERAGVATYYRSAALERLSVPWSRATRAGFVALIGLLLWAGQSVVGRSRRASQK